jgi:hypothetical protein
MKNQLNAYKRTLGVQWIRGRSNTTYLCPVNALIGIEDPSEDQLRALCVEESMNPQNN